MKKKNITKLMRNRFFEEAKFPSTNSKALLSIQLLHKKRKSWSKSEKNIALSLFILLHIITTNRHPLMNLCVQTI